MLCPYRGKKCAECFDICNLDVEAHRAPGQLGGPSVNIRVRYALLKNTENGLYWSKQLLKWVPKLLAHRYTLSEMTASGIPYENDKLLWVKDE